jgi:hypothetical protein
VFVRAAFIVGHFDFDYFFQVDSQVSAKVRDPDHRVSQFDGHAFGLSTSVLAKAFFAVHKTFGFVLWGANKVVAFVTSEPDVRVSVAFFFQGFGKFAVNQCDRRSEGKGRFPESVFHGVFMCFCYKCFDFHIVLPLCIRNNFDPDFLAAEVKGVFVVIEEYVDLLAAYGSAAILDGPFAYAFYVKDSTWRIDGPVGRDSDAFFGYGSAGRVDDTVRAVQRPFSTAYFTRTVSRRHGVDPFLRLCGWFIFCNGHRRRQNGRGFV